MNKQFEKAPEQPGVNMLVDLSAKAAFEHWLDHDSDIRGHLYFLFEKSGGVVVELGTRGGVSTSALLAGVEVQGGHVTSIDLDPLCGETFDGHPQWDFLPMSSIDDNAPQLVLSSHIEKKGFVDDIAFIDLLFIDTDHNYNQLRTELEIWEPFVKRGGMIVMHDVETFPEMAKAAAEFADEYKKIYTVRSGSNGLGVLKM